VATISGTFVESDQASTDRANMLIDDYLLQPLLSFRQITIYNEILQQQADGKWRTTYQNWNSGFPILVRVNGQIIPVASLSSIDYINGIIDYADDNANDDVRLTYNFQYFTGTELEWMAKRAVDQINGGSSQGSPTDYTLSSAPSYWDAIIADLIVAFSMERLIADFTMWRGRLIYALGTDALSGGSSDAVSQLETLKENAEERAYRALDNPQFKAPPYLSRPTVAYFRSINGIGGGSIHGNHGGVMPNYGKLRGARFNVWRKI